MRYDTQRIFSCGQTGFTNMQKGIALVNMLIILLNNIMEAEK